MTRPGEVALIDRFFAPLATDAAALGLLDDTAVFTPAPGNDLVVTADALAAGVHFFADDPADLVARKALRVNLSDLAAKGATPRGYLLTIALPRDWTESWLSAFSAGLAADQAEFAVPLLGGDTIATDGPLTLSITALGEVAAGRALRRAAARPGDRLFVSGTIGDAALGLALRLNPELAGDVSAGEAQYLVGRYLLPRPRLALGPALRAHARAGIDVSDGLVTDIGKLCRAAGLGARLNADRVPLSPGARALLAARGELLATVIDGGDDYEIVAAVDPASADAFAEAAALAGVPVVDIGVLDGRQGTVRLVDESGREISLERRGYEHF
ncbi:MAG: thiamine-phosphate kinase [Hyphomicrobiales bacterium]